MTSDAKRGAHAPLTFSIALPVRNGANYLRPALESILTQTYPHFELVVSDNASTDETPAILAEFAARDSRIRVERSDTSLGHAENVNRSISLSRHEWVKLFCHDDLMRADCLEKLAGAVNEAKDSVGLVGNGEVHLFANGVRKPASPPGPDTAVFAAGPELVRKSITGEAALPLPALTTALVRRQAWERAGRFDPRFSLFDAFLWPRVLLDWDYMYVAPPLTVNRIHSAQVVVSARKTLRAVSDHRVFWKEFLRENGEKLRLGFVSRLKVQAKPITSAGAFIAIEILKAHPLNALSIVLRSPLLWWPLLPLATLRAYRNERRRVKAFADTVPASLIYPD